MLFLQDLGNSVDGKIQFPQKADDLQALQIIVRVEPPSAFGKLTGNQDAPGIIVLNRPDRDAAELCKLSRRVF